MFCIFDKPLVLKLEELLTAFFRNRIMQAASTAARFLEWPSVGYCDVVRFEKLWLGHLVEPAIHERER